MLYVVPIEPLEERYSKQWNRWCIDYLAQNNIENYLVGGRTYGQIKHGAFLDIVGTNIYKNSQMAHILDMFDNNVIKNGDVFWFHDMWFPGLEMLAYIRDALAIDFKIYGMLHSGTYDPHDFLSKRGMHKWGHSLEQSWLNIVDGVFVATKYHKELLQKERNCADKVHVTGFPIYADSFVQMQWHLKTRENTIVFPHRLDDEKNPRMFAHFERQVQIHTDKFVFVRTKDVCRTKDEYYNVLRSAKYAVSFASQETWGIAMQEAVLCGCIPIVPDRLSYSEMYPTMFKYGNNENYYSAYSTFRMCEDNIALAHSQLKELQQKIRFSGEWAFERMMRIMGLI